MFQMSLFDGEQPFKLNAPIRLIELFAGYGSQALALKYLGVPFEHHHICEWAVKSIQAYKDLHFADDHTDYSAELTEREIYEKLFAYGISADYNKPMTLKEIVRLKEKRARQVYNNIQATHNLVSVCNATAEMLGISETDKYCYIMTYSFPCQDLSSAGKGMGMAKDSGTRSGLLWEVERLLRECRELPQVLIMENVPQVVGKKNMPHFADWLKFLDGLGYKSKWQILNATDFSIPQNRERCFMVSILGDYFYNFPTPTGCALKLKDVLEKKVPESYYLKKGTIIKLAEHKARHEAKGNGFGWKPIDPDGGGYFARTVKTNCGYRHTDTFVVEKQGQNLGKTNGLCKHDNGTRLQGFRELVNECSNGIVTTPQQADGIHVGKSRSFTKPPLENTARTILADSSNGVVEWKK